jgi:hypothetical protein
VTLHICGGIAEAFGNFFNCRGLTINLQDDRANTVEFKLLLSEQKQVGMAQHEKLKVQIEGTSFFIVGLRRDELLTSGTAC